MKMFDAGKTRMIGLPYRQHGEKNYDDMLSRFHLIPERYGRTDRRTDIQTDLLYQISRVSMLRAIKIAIFGKYLNEYLACFTINNCFTVAVYRTCGRLSV